MCKVGGCSGAMNILTSFVRLLLLLLLLLSLLLLLKLLVQCHSYLSHEVLRMRRHNYGTCDNTISYWSLYSYLGADKDTVASLNILVLY